MSASKIKAVMHVAPTRGGWFGIRIRLTRNSTGVWLGTGAKQEELPEGAQWLSRPGEWYWVWSTREAAQAHLDSVVQENAAGLGGEE